MEYITFKEYIHDFIDSVEARSKRIEYNIKDLSLMVRSNYAQFVTIKNS